ncbi:ImmA/IrrE family metallo-endopeptidase [Bifidobacterium tissieri]|uniref:ImmA/IrrE family metallo-endopeptidase n=1 Tax=Bifidobacterium tissieri TaxID=1630162 RepID=UPI001CC2D6E4|nr:ImmA/IrrE family metallo-endopeptidase [Bifidobacterium tissieri]
MRMQIYAAGLDLTVGSVGMLPGITNGCYSEATHTILIDRRLPYVAKRCTLVHELVHWQHGDDRCGIYETRTRRETALLLIDRTAYARAEQTYEGDRWRIADELDVTIDVVDDFQQILAYERARHLS